MRLITFIRTHHKPGLCVTKARQAELHKESSVFEYIDFEFHFECV